MRPFICLIILLSFLKTSFASVPWTDHDNENGYQAGNDAFLTASVVEGQLFLTVPEEVLDRPILFVRYNQSGKRRFMHVIWSLQGDRMLLRVPSIRSTAGIILPIKPNLTIEENILSVFPIGQKEMDLDKYQIDITALVLHQNIEWEPGFTENLVPAITLLEGAKNLEDEVIIKTQRGLVMGESKVSLPTFYGFSALPDPMRARRFDYRMGFYDEETTGIHFWLRNSPANISRWSLQKKFKDQKVSVPVKPITFLMSPDIPKKWRPYIKAGIAEWLPAFESAGFKDALLVKEMDSLDEWQAHSIHSNIIYWSQNKYFRGSEYEDYGGTVAKIIDFRTGEILRGDIFMGASERTVMEKYFVRAAPLDKRARRFPFPDELVGSLFQVIAAHEAGHIFGLKDGNYGEYTYPWEKMNDSLWLRTMGHTPSIMNYTRSSNIPQPEDGISPSLLIQKVGPTDRYNIQWAYTEYPLGTSIVEEIDDLERMIRLQDSVPWYRFNNRIFEVIGPAASNEVVETNDLLRSTPLALKNLKRVIELLPEANRDQKDNDRLDRLYEKTLELWYNHMVHVLTMIGGYDVHYKSISQEGSRYTPISLEEQRKALEFLMTNAFDAPQWLTEPSFHSKTRFSSFPDKVSDYQQRLFMELIMAPRLKRLEHMEKRLGPNDLIQSYLSALQSGLFKELREHHKTVEPRRQAIQTLYIEQVIQILNQERPRLDPQQQFFAHSDYIKSLMMGRLMSIKQEIEKGIEGNWDASSKWHWQVCLGKIDRM